MQSRVSMVASVFSAFVASAWVTGGSVVALAQGGEESGGSAASTADQAPAPESAPAAPSAKTASGKSQTDTGTFKLRRGLYAEADLGLFMTFGGRNTNLPDLPSKGASNIQPTLGFTVGYDLVHSPAFSFGLGIGVAMHLNGGAGRVKAEDIQAGVEDQTTKSNDFVIIPIGLAPMVSILLSDRLALSIRGDGGMALLNPDPTTAAATSQPRDESIVGAGSSAFAPFFGVGAGLEYFTLLNDFSVGVRVSFLGVLRDGFIPGATATFPIKYTF